jgi:hypothetical protein
MGRGMDDRGAVLDHEARHGGWIARARAAARNIAAGKGEITIDDVRAVCPPPDGVDPRIMGAVFQKDRFVRVGFAVSERRACHGRMIGVFRLRASARRQDG